MSIETPTASDILALMAKRKEQANTARIKQGRQLHAILLEKNPMPKGLWDSSILNFLKTGFFGTKGVATQKPQVVDGFLIMEKDGYGISKAQLDQFEKAGKSRSEKVADNSDALRKGVTAFTQTKDCEVTSLSFNAGVTGKKAKLDVSMTATPTTATAKKLTL